MREYYVGGSIPIRDAAAKATGEKQYTCDIRLPGMLHAALLTSPVAHARIAHIDISEALASPGVRAVACCENSADTPYNGATRLYEQHIEETEQIFSRTVRFVGDRVAAVAADSYDEAKRALSKIRVEYEPLPAVFDPERALKPDAYPIHGADNIAARVQLVAGDVEKALSKAYRVFEDRYETQAVHHGALERHIALASCGADGRLTVIAPQQNSFAARMLLARIFHLPMSRILFQTPAIGGAFGGKLELTAEPVAAQLAIMTRRPVRLEYTRKACIETAYTRYATVSYIRTGVDRDGHILAQDIRLIANSGAHAGSARMLLGAMSHKVFKVYRCENMRFTGTAVYTNTPNAGAMRGYGSPQAFFAQQCQMKQIADALGLSQLEMQRRNMVRPDDRDAASSVPIGNPRPLDCLARAERLMQNWPPVDTENGRYLYGTGIALGAHGNGCFGAHRDQICLMLKMNEDGSCVLFSGSHDMGNASHTAQTQVIADELCLPLSHIALVSGDTDVCAWNLGDFSSHGVFVACGAAKRLAERMREALLCEASALLGAPAETLCYSETGVQTEDGTRGASLAEIVVFAQDKRKRDLILTETYAMPSGPSSYGVHAARVRVDRETGEARLTDYVAVHDVGNVINRMSIEGQLAGGIQMGAGYALREGLDFDENGRNRNVSFKRASLLRASEMPRMQLDFIEAGEPNGPYGAKSIGECATVPSAPAVINALSDALGRALHALPYWKNGKPNL